jgi:hypothetical protein
MSTVLKFPRRARARRRGRKKAQETFVADLSSLRIILDRFVFDERRGTFHRVSESAAFIVAELKKGRGPHELSETYAARYGVPRAIAERDVELLLNDLSAVQLAAQHVATAPPFPARQ